MADSVVIQPSIDKYKTCILLISFPVSEVILFLIV